MIPPKAVSGGGSTRCQTMQQEIVKKPRHLTCGCALAIGNPCHNLHAVSSAESPPSNLVLNHINFENTNLDESAPECGPRESV